MEALTRIIAFLLAFLLGFCSFFICLAGGCFYVYTSLSYDDLVEQGIAPSAEEYLSSDAEVSLTSLTIQKMVKEVMELKEKQPEEVTVDILLERYGVQLPEGIIDYVPTTVREIPLATLFTSEGLNTILDDTTIDFALKFVPEGTLSAPAIETLGGKTLRQVINLDLTNLLDNVYLGYFLGVDYALNEETGEYSVVYADANSPSLFELVSTLDLGRVLNSFSGNEDLTGVIKDCLGSVLLQHVTNILGLSDNTIVSALLDGKIVDDLLKEDESTGSVSIDVFALLKGRSVGYLLGYTAIHQTGDETSPIIGWKDADGNDVVGFMRGLACASLDHVGEEDFDYFSLLSNLYVGDVLNYVPQFKEDGTIESWKTKEGGDIEPLYETLVSVCASDLFEEDFEFSSLANGLYIGSVLGYTKQVDPNDADSFIWYEEDGTTKVTGIFATLSGIDLGQILSGEKEITDILDGMTVGTLLGYTKDENTGIWRDEKGDPASGMYEALVEVDIGRLINNDPDYQITDAFDGVYLGTILGYTKVLDPNDATIIDHWEKDSVELSGIDAVLAKIDLGKLISGESKVEDLFDDTYVGTLLGYTKQEDGWYNGTEKLSGVDAVIAKIDLGKLLSGDESYSITEEFDGLYLGELLGYQAVYGDPLQPTLITGWKNGDTAVTGVDEVLAKVNLGNIINDDNFDMVSIFENTYLGTLLGYGGEKGAWTENGTPVTGINSIIADVDLGKLLDSESDYDISKVFDNVYLGTVLGYTKVLNGSQLVGWTNAGVAVTGIDKTISNIELGKLLNDPSYDISSAFSGTALGDLLGYTKDDNGKWLENSQEVTGMNATIANIDLGDLMGDGFDIMSIFNGMYLGEALSYTPVYEEEVLTGWKNGTADVTGINKTIANIELGKLLNDPSYDISSAFNGTLLGDLLGYTKDANGNWMNNSTQVVGIENAVANINLGSLMGDPNFKISSIFAGMYLGDAMGYTKVVDPLDETKHTGWKNGATAVTGIDAIISDVDLEAIIAGEGFDFATLFNGVLLGEMLGYTKNAQGKWVDSQNNLITGISQTTSNIDLGQLLGGGSYDLAAIFNDTKLGDVLGYTQNGDDWYDGSTQVTGFMGVIASKCVGDMGSLMDELTVADALGYTTSDNVNFVDENDQPVTGIMSVMAPKHIGEIGTSMSTIQIGEIMGWEYTGSTWYDGTNPSSGILVQFASFTIDQMTDSSAMSNAIQNIQLGEALGYTFSNNKWYDSNNQEVECTGFLSLIGLDTKVGEMTTKINSTFNDTPIQSFLDNQIFEFDASTQSMLTTMFGDENWREKPIKDFINSLIAKMTELQNQINYYKGLVP